MANNYGAANVLNQYPTVTPVGGSPQTMSYDGNGNLTGDGTWTFAYDAENKLMTAGKSGTSASYDYDGSGHRAAKVVGTGGAATTTSYLEDPSGNEIGEYGAAGSPLRYYVPGPALNDPIAMITASDARTYFHKDKQGSVAAMSDAGGNLVEGPYTYDAYGNCIVASGACGGGEPFLYAGMRFDPETDSTTTGRAITQHPWDVSFRRIRSAIKTISTGTPMSEMTLRIRRIRRGRVYMHSKWRWKD